MANAKLTSADRPSVQKMSMAAARVRGVNFARAGALRSGAVGAPRSPCVRDRARFRVVEAVADQLRLRLNQPADASVADWEQPAELLEHLVLVQADGSRIVAHERAREDAGRPAAEVVPFEAVPEVGADLGDRRDGFE